MIFWAVKKTKDSYIVLQYKNSIIILSNCKVCLVNYWNLLQYKKLIKYVLLIWDTLIYFKLKYKHKIYNVKFTTVFKQFNIITKILSHFLLLEQSFFHSFKIKKLSSFNTYMFFFSNFYTFYTLLARIKKYLKWNIYTQRGFRLARDRLNKKTGKVSAFKSFKSKIF